MKKYSWLLVLLLVFTLILTGCADSLANGEIYFCKGKVAFDFITLTPQLVRFSCENPAAIVEFTIPEKDTDLVYLIRQRNLQIDVGIVLNKNNELIQFFEYSKKFGGVHEIWNIE